MKKHKKIASRILKSTLELLALAFFAACAVFCAMGCGKGGQPTIQSAISPPAIVESVRAADVTIPSDTGEAPLVLGASIVVTSNSAGRIIVESAYPVEAQNIASQKVMAKSIARVAAVANKSDIECRIKVVKRSDSSVKMTAWFPCADTEAMKGLILTEGTYDFVVQSRAKGGSNAADITETDPTEITVTADVAVEGNAKPAIGAISCDSQSVEVGAKLTCSAASHTDTDVTDSQSCKIDWGDGNVDTYPAPCSTEQSHAYLDAGDGTLAVTMYGTDGKDASNVETLDVTVTVPTTPATLTAPAWTTTVTETINDTYEITGTKPAGSAIYSNGVEIVPADGLTTWTHVFSLPSELNTFVLVAIMPDGSKSLPEELTIPRSLPPAEPILAPDTPTLTDLATDTIYVYAPTGADLYYRVNGGEKVKIKDAKSVFDKSQMEAVAFAPTLAADATSTYTFISEDPNSSLTSDPGTTWTVYYDPTEWYYPESTNIVPGHPVFEFYAKSVLGNKRRIDFFYQCAGNCANLSQATCVKAIENGYDSGCNDNYFSLDPTLSAVELQVDFQVFFSNDRSYYRIRIPLSTP